MSFDSSRATSGAGDLRALSHPLRLRLMDLLELEGPMTATEAAGRLATTPSNASFHLRLLARHGFVEEAPGGRGRQRPWQRVDRPVHVDSDQLDDDGRHELRAVLEVMLARHRDHVLGWHRNRESYPQPWRDAAGEVHTVVHLTSDELEQLNSALHQALSAVADRPARPGTKPVAVLLSTLPMEQP